MRASRVLRVVLVGLALAAGIGYWAVVLRPAAVYRRQPVSHWIQALKSDDPAVRRDAARALIAWGPKAHYYLGRTLTSPDEDVRQKAVDAMAEAGPRAVPSLLAAILMHTSGDLSHNGGLAALMKMGPRSVPPLVKALRSRYRLVRISAATALGFHGLAGRLPEASLSALARVLQKDRDAEVRAAAADSLGFCQPVGNTALSALVAALTDDSEIVRVTAAQGLARSSVESAAPPAKAAAGLDVLTQGLQSQDETVRYRAILGLTYLGSRAASAVPDLIAMLDDEGLGWHAALALAEIGGDAVPALRDAVHTGSLLSRANAAMALEQLGRHAPAAVGELLADLQSPDPDTRRRAAQALGDAAPADSSAVPALIAALDDRDPYVRQSAAYALARYGSQAKDALPRLITMLEDDAFALDAAATALGGIGPAAAPAAPALRAALSREPYASVPRALARIGKPALPALISALQDPNDQARASAAFAICLLGPDAADAVPALIPALRDRQPTVRDRAAQALADIGPAAAPAVPQLIAALDDPDAAVRSSAADALGRIGEPARAAAPRLAAVLANQPDPDPQFVLALFRLGSGRSAVPALIRLATTPDGRFRLEAISLLGKLGPQAAEAADTLAAIMNHRGEWYTRRLASALSLARIRPRDPDPLSYLLRALDSHTASEGVAAAAALVELEQAETEVAAEVRKFLLAISDGLRIRAAAILARLDPKDQEMVALLNGLVSGDDPEMGVQAAAALAHLGLAGGEAVQVLLAGVRDENFAHRGLAVQALGEIGPRAKAALPELAELLYESDRKLRRVARVAVKKIEGELPTSYQDPASPSTFFLRYLGSWGAPWGAEF